jgi:hypothetical protein
MPSVEEVMDLMFKMVERDAGQKKYKPTDLTKATKERWPDVDRKTPQAAIKELVDSGKLVYTYFGGSFLEIPHREGAAND